MPRVASSGHSRTAAAPIPSAHPYRRRGGCSVLVTTASLVSARCPIPHPTVVGEFPLKGRRNARTAAHDPTGASWWSGGYAGFMDHRHVPSGKWAEPAGMRSICP
jgi:hypothetical protein